MKQKVMCLIIVLAAAFALAGCSDGATDANAAEQEEKMKIGFSMGTLLEDRWIRDREIMMSKAQQEGIDIIVTNANRDSDLQYRQVGEMLEQGIDVLILAPSDSATEGRCVELAHQKGIPVIAYDRLIYNANVDAYVSFDNVKVGELMAEALMEKVPKGGYVIVNGSPDDHNCTLINEGVRNVLDASLKSGDIRILDETSVNGWVRETAHEFMVNCIEANGDNIDAVVVANDSLAWGVIDALSEAQMTDVLVVGQDADLVACRRIVQGKQLMTVYKPIKNLVEAAMEVSIKLVNDEEITEIDTMNDGTYDVPFIACDVIAVTKDNMRETVIKDNFHLEEEVYV